jgi:hypothetical protein
MKTKANDVIAQMKNEDRKFGERMRKNTVAKNQKYRQDFKNMTPDELRGMSEDLELEYE